MTNTPETKVASSTHELLAAGKALGAPIQLAGVPPYLIVPAGWQIHPLPAVALPDYIQQRVALSDAESFIAYVNQYKTPATVLFCEKKDAAAGGVAAVFTAVFDYHDPITGANRCRHVATYGTPYSDEWKAWKAVDGKAMGQEAFINFIEANAPDVVDPDSASLMEFTTNFETKTDVTFASRIDRVTGGVCIGFKEDISGATKDGVLRNIPARLGLSVPVFANAVVNNVKARLEWKPSGGKLSVTVHLVRSNLVLAEALEEVMREIAAGCSLRILSGKAAETKDAGSW